MFDIQRNFDPQQLPDGDTVLCFQFPDLTEYQKWWLLNTDGDIDICYEDPGKEIDVYITSKLKTLADAYMGDRDLVSAVEIGDIKVLGDTQLARRFGKWFPRSEAAAVPRSTD
jgi:hypothetical protein